MLLLGLSVYVYLDYHLLAKYYQLKEIIDPNVPWRGPWNAGSPPQACA